MSVRDGRLRTVVGFYFVCILTGTACFGYRNMRMQGDWSMADWLINYSGGFVRRGLIGEVALLFSRFHVSPFAFVLALQLALYGVLFYTVWHLLDRMRWSLWLLALVFSPATLMFPLLDPLFAFRKEELLFATLSVLILLLIRESVSDLLLSIGLTIACVVCVLSHEGLALYSLYLFGALWLHCSSWKRSLGIALAPACAVLLTLAAVSRFPGDLAVSKAICASIGSTLTDPPTGVCAGAIAYLAHDQTDARKEVLQLLRSTPYASLVVRLAVLALLPFFFALAQLWRDRRMRGELRIWAGTALASVVLTAPLFFYAVDWTRWVYIHVMCMLLLLLMIEGRRRRLDGQQAVPYRLLPLSPWRRAVVVVVFLGYLWGWDLAVYQPRVPYGGLVHYLYRQHQASAAYPKSL